MTTASSFTREPTVWSPAQDGRSIPASCMLPDRSSPTSRRSTAMSLRCSSPKWKDASSAGSCSIKDVPAEHHKDLDYPGQHARLGSQHEPGFRRDQQDLPQARTSVDEMKAEGYIEKWITYGTPYYSAKELTVLPGRAVTIKDAAAYGVIVTQGYGTMARQPVSTPSMIRFGEMTEDEVFVTAASCQRRGAHRESQRIRSSRHAQALRSRQSRGTTTDTEISTVTKPNQHQHPATSQRHVARPGRQGPGLRAADRSRHHARPHRARPRSMACASTASICSSPCPTPASTPPTTT